MQDLEDLLSKLYPMAEEFAPPSLASPIRAGFAAPTPLSLDAYGYYPANVGFAVPSLTGHSGIVRIQSCRRRGRGPQQHCFGSEAVATREAPEQQPNHQWQGEGHSGDRRRHMRQWRAAAAVSAPAVSSPWQVCWRGSAPAGRCITAGRGACRRSSVQMAVIITAGRRVPAEDGIHLRL
jgi:hypothetical protein